MTKNNTLLCPIRDACCYKYCLSAEGCFQKPFARARFG